MKKTLLALLIFSACASNPVHFTDLEASKKLIRPEEVHFSKMKQITFRGENAESYWSFDSQYLNFQHSGPDPLGREKGGFSADKCDQIYRISANGENLTRLSNGKGRTTCSFSTADSKRVLYSSTFAGDEACPPAPDQKQGYVWPLYPQMRIYSAKNDGKDTFPVEPSAPTAYTAEATVCKDGTVVYTSDRSGDLELYTAKINSMGGFEEVKQITKNIGYDGGAVFSPDCQQLAWRASRPRTQKAVEDYTGLLKQNLVRPSQMELWISKVDGSEARQLTHLDAASFAPFFTPEGDALVFSSNFPHPRGRVFNLLKVKTDGTELEQITFSNTFDSFPMFSPSGKYLAFASNRNSKVAGQTNVFIAEWNPDSLGKNKISTPIDQIKSNVQTLASAEFEGRGMSTRGIELAESFVEKRLKALGLNPLPGSQTLRHAVEFQSGVQVDEAKTSLQIQSKKLELGKDFSPNSFSSSGIVSGETLDLGYGLVIPELGRDDYKDKNVMGKILLIRRFTPKELGLSEAQKRSYSDLRRKAYIAREKGAKGILFFSDEEGTPENFKLQYEAGELVSEAGLLSALVKRTVALELISKRVTLAVGLDRTKATRYNLIGTLGSSCSQKKNWVLVGAHLDHLGFGGGGNSFDRSGAIHPGADDNASGVAGVLRIAEKLKSQKNGCYAFAAFTGEEMGIVGSSALVKELKFRKIQVKAMLNLDMVGRLLNGQMLAFGSDTSSGWNEILQTSCGEAGLDCKYSGDGYGPSDHMPFFMNGIPVLHFFTGAHADYHRPSDTFEKINFVGIEQTAQLVSRVAIAAATESKLELQIPRGTPSNIGHEASGDTRSFGAYLGTIPDYTEMQMGGSNQNQGAKLAGAQVGSPAEIAGIKNGDVLRRIIITGEGAKSLEVQNLQDFANALQELRPDQKIQLVVFREGKEMTLDATIGRKTKN